MFQTNLHALILHALSDTFLNDFYRMHLNRFDRLLTFSCNAFSAQFVGCYVSGARSIFNELSSILEVQSASSSCSI